MPEPNEVFFVTLSSATNATIADNQGIGTIVDDDSSGQPPFSISIQDAQVIEGDSGNSNAQFRVVLSSISTQLVTVDFSTADGSAIAGSDYVAQTGRVTFVPGDVIRVITVPVVGDNIDEFDEAFFVNLSNASNATIVDAQATGIIINDDSLGSPQLAINDVAVVEGAVPSRNRREWSGRAGRRASDTRRSREARSGGRVAMEGSGRRDAPGAACGVLRRHPRR